MHTNILLFADAAEAELLPRHENEQYSYVPNFMIHSTYFIHIGPSFKNITNTWIYGEEMKRQRMEVRKLFSCYLFNAHNIEQRERHTHTHPPKSSVIVWYRHRFSALCFLRYLHVATRECVASKIFQMTPTQAHKTPCSNNMNKVTKWWNK